MSEAAAEKHDFIRAIIREDLETGRETQVVTRFPPEPNGYLHLGHVKAICTNFGIAKEFGGRCNLRFDDTNPLKEDDEFVESIKEDVSWLGFEWAGEPKHASDYFGKLYEAAVKLIRQGDAYVDRQTPEEMKAGRGSFTQVGSNSPYRDTSVEENLEWFEKMRSGELPDGAAVLRAKIDMQSPNMVMRDPALYRVMHMSHHQTGDQWCIYPMYDMAHPLSDAFEGVTHSLCTLEFEEHRPLYDWLIEKVGFENPPHQYEFARLNLENTLTSKRKLKALVDQGVVIGWDDPRMPTVAGMRRRGYTASGLRDFCDRVGLSKAGGTVDTKQLEFSIRQSLELEAARAMVVFNPLKVTISNFEELEGLNESGTALNLKLPAHPNNESMGERVVPLTKTLYIDRSDFELVPPPKFKRLIPEGEVRLRGAHVMRCDQVVMDGDQVLELVCSIDLNTLGKNPEGRKVKGVIHWVSATESKPVEVRLYNPLFNLDPAEHELEEALNPESLKVVTAYAEPSLAQAEPEERFQFEREAYFVADRHDHNSNKPVFNRVIELRAGF